MSTGAGDGDGAAVECCISRDVLEENFPQFTLRKFVGLILGKGLRIVLGFSESEPIRALTHSQRHPKKSDYSKRIPTKTASVRLSDLSAMGLQPLLFPPVLFDDVNFSIKPTLPSSFPIPSNKLFNKEIHMCVRLNRQQKGFIVGPIWLPDARS